MVEFLYGDDLSQRIRQVARGANAYCAVAFWGEGAAFEVFGDDYHTRNDVTIVLDISMGGTNPKTIHELGAPDNKSLRYIDGLHAKVYISDSGAVVGSANASSNGIGDIQKSARHTEAGAFFEPKSPGWLSAVEWYKSIQKKASKIDEIAIIRAEAAWKSRKKLPHEYQVDRPLLNILDYNPEEFGLILPLWFVASSPIEKTYPEYAGEIEKNRWTTVAEDDANHLNCWILTFRTIGGGDRLATNPQLGIFFSNMRREAPDFEEAYPVLYFQSKKTPAPRFPFDIYEDLFINCFRKVIDLPKYRVLRYENDDQVWRLKDHLNPPYSPECAEAA